MTWHITKEKLLQNCTLFLLFLAGMNVGNRYYYFLLLASVFFLLFRQSFKIDGNTLTLLLLSISWVIFSPDELAVTSIIKPFLYPLVYIAGRNFFILKEGRNDLPYIESRFKTIILWMAAGPYVHYLLNYMTNSGFDSRNTIDIWTGTVFSATGQAVMGSLMLAIAISLIFVSDKVSKKFVYLFIVSSILLYNLILSGRTLLLVAMIIVGISTVFLYREASIARDKLKIIFAVLGMLFLFYWMFTQNTFGIRGYIMESNFFNRFFSRSTETLFVDTRVSIKIKYLQKFGESFFGGRHLFNAGYGYAHDLYLDTYDEAGILALLAVVGFSVSAVYCLIRVLKEKVFGLPLRLLLLSIYVTFFIVFMIEPILQGAAWLFATFCFLHGVLVQIESLSKRIEKTRLEFEEA